MATKTTKQKDLDPTNQPQAKTAADVNAQDKRTRLWQSLDYTYGKKRDESDKAYDKAYSQADRQALGRGMQRSSYNNQTLANLNKQKIDAQNDIYDAQIAAYQSGIGDIEKEEAEAERWEKEFNANREDTAWNQGFQQQQFEQQKADTAWNQAFQTSQFEKQKADTAWSQGMQEKQFAEDQANTRWNQAFQTSQFEQQKADTAWEQAYKDRSLDAQLAQWDKQFEYTKMSDEQKIAYTTATTMLQQHIMPSDALLAAAGISKEDAQAMVNGAKSSGNYYGPSKTPTAAGDGTENNKSSEDDMFARMSQYVTTQKTAAQTAALQTARQNYNSATDEKNRYEKVENGKPITRQNKPYVKD